MQIVLEILSWAFLLTGCFFAVVGGIGLLRLPDFYTRIHAAGLTDTVGAGLILLGLAFHGPDAMIIVKILLLLVFLLLTSPTSGHALAKAAWHRGLEPWTAAKGKETRDQ